MARGNQRGQLVSRDYGVPRRLEHQECEFWARLATVHFLQLSSRSGKAVSWCQTTSQFAVGDLSKSVARKGNAPLPRICCAIPKSREPRAIAATVASFMAWR